MSAVETARLRVAAETLRLRGFVNRVCDSVQFAWLERNSLRERNLLHARATHVRADVLRLRNYARQAVADADRALEILKELEEAEL